MKLENKEFQDYFNSMEQMRFKDLGDIKEYLRKFFVDAKIDLYFKSYEDDDFFPNDYEIVCEIYKENNYLLDLDLYFLYDRRNMIYITEHGVETQ